MSGEKLIGFVRESNRIEGIERQPEEYELDAHRRLLASTVLTTEVIEDFVFDICGKRLRDQDGMDVRVGGHFPPPGGAQVRINLDRIVGAINLRNIDPYEAHIAYEGLHPFMDGNGRSGRAIWAWQMFREGRGPYSLPFLHRFYYQTLDHSNRGCP